MNHLGLSGLQNLERRIIQRNSCDCADLVISDYESPIQEPLETRLVYGTEILQDWQALHNGSLTFRDVPAGGWYSIEMRISGKDETKTTVVQKIGVGDVYLTSGQSNAACFGSVRTTARHDTVSTFHPVEKKWYVCSDIQPSISEFNSFADRNGGSPWPTAGDILTETLGVPIGFVLTGCGAAGINSYHPNEKSHYQYLTTAIDSLRNTGFRAILWHQGETDALRGTPKETYLDTLLKIVQATRAYAGFEIPWVVAQAAYHIHSGATPEHQRAIRAAQQSACMEEKNRIYLGPDTDVLGPEFRDAMDHVHFNGEGLIRHGQMWAASILELLKKHPDAF